MADLAVKIMTQKASPLSSSLASTARRLQRRDSDASFLSLKNDDDFDDCEDKAEGELSE